MYPDNKMKALTFSYDDGVISDKRLISIFDKYHLKATFNLNSGIQSNASNWNYKGFNVKRINQSEIGNLYADHEVAVHCLTHADLSKCDNKTAYNELYTDKKNLERLYNTSIHGMAYPYGTFNKEIPKLLRDCSLMYGRTVESTHSFDIPSDTVVYNPTCHHNDNLLFDLAEEFISLTPSEPKLFYVWGHSYEFDADETWERIELFCRLIAGKSDIFYCTNYEAFSQY